MIGLILIFVIGGLIGYAVAKIWSMKKPVGTIRIDSSDPDGPYLFLELGEPVEYLKKQETATLRIKTESYITQK